VSSTWERRRARESAKARGGGAVCFGVRSPFYRGWGGGGQAVTGGNDRRLMTGPLMDGEV
jgi:hypothetical protein